MGLIASYIKTPARLALLVIIFFSILCLPHLSFAANYYAIANGNWSASSTWSTSLNGSAGTNTPGPGDCAEIANGYQVTVTENTTIGPDSTSSPSSGGCGGGTAIEIGSANAATATAKLFLADGVTLDIKGDISTFGGNSGSAQPGYCSITGNASSVLEFDSSDHPATQYQLGPDPSDTYFNYAFSALCSGNDTTHANRFTIMSNANGGAAYMPSNYYEGGMWQLNHVTIKNFGDSTNYALYYDDYGTNYGEDAIITTMNDVQLINSGEIYYTGGTGTTQVSMINVQCLEPAATGCMYTNLQPPTGGAVRVLRNFSNFPGAPFDTGSATAIDGWTIDKNFIYGSINWGGSSGGWTSLNENIFIDTVLGGSYSTFGPITNNYKIYDYDGGHDHYWSVTLGGENVTGNIADTNAYSSAYGATNGFVVLGQFTNYTNPLNVKGNISLCGADTANNSPGTLVAGMSPGMTVNTENNTSCESWSAGTESILGDNPESNPPDADTYPDFKGNLGYQPAPGSTNSLFNEYYNLSCVQDVLIPSETGYNASWNLNLSPYNNACDINSGNGYNGDFSVTPPGVGSDLTNVNPNFVDDNRGIQQAGIKFFGESVAPAWQSSTTYSSCSPLPGVGQTVSTQDPNYYRGLTINWQCIANNTSTSTNKPGAKDGTWRTYWEPTGWSDYMLALYNGTTYTIPGCTNCDVADAFHQWIANGMSPTNAAYAVAAAPNSHIGAESVTDTTPPSITWISPTANATVSSTITLTVSSTDDFAVSSTAFYVGSSGGTFASSTLISATSTVNGALYSITWNTSSTANGYITLWALSTDTSNNTSTASTTVNIQNVSTPPPSNNPTPTAVGGGGSTYSVTINGGAETTQNTNITLSLYGTEAYTMEISNSSTFAGTSWIPYVTTLPWTLPSTLGNEPIYVQFRTVNGDIVGNARASIDLIPAATATPTAAPATTPSMATTASLTNELTYLESQLAALQAQANGSTITSNRFTFTRDLFLNMTGSDVQELQQFLIAQNSGIAAQKLAAHGTTTAFGNLTLNALIEFQKKENIKPAVGYFGPITRAYVNSVY